MPSAHSDLDRAVAETPGKREYKGLAESIFAGAFVFGVVMSALGAILPALFGSIGFGKVDAGRLFLVMNFAMLISSLLFGPICDRFGFRAILLLSTLLISASFGGLALAESYPSLLVSLAVLGLGGGALNGGTNALLNDISAERRASALNRLGIYFGTGALFIPILIGSLLESTGLRLLLVLLLLLAALPVVLFGKAHFPAAKHQGGFILSELSAVLKNPLLFLFGLLLFFQSGNEFTMGGWISSFLIERHGLDARVAAYALSGYWAALMLGRWIVSRSGSRFPAPAVVMISAFIALTGACGMMLAPAGVPASISAALVGLGFAAIFPTVLAQAGGIFAGFSGTAFSVIFAMALSGGMLAPWMFGRVAQNRGIGSGFWITIGSCAAIILLQAAIRLRSNQSSAKPRL